MIIDTFDIYCKSGLLSGVDFCYFVSYYTNRLTSQIMFFIS